LPSFPFLSLPSSLFPPTECSHWCRGGRQSSGLISLVCVSAPPLSSCPWTRPFVSLSLHFCTDRVEMPVIALATLGESLHLSDLGFLLCSVRGNEDGGRHKEQVFVVSCLCLEQPFYCVISFSQRRMTISQCGDFSCLCVAPSPDPLPSCIPILAALTLLPDDHQPA
jgi:hypothetical protein